MGNNNEQPFVKVKGDLDIPDVKVLDLPLKKEWYNMIESGDKIEEYREIKPYWQKRLMSCYGAFDCEKVGCINPAFDWREKNDVCWHHGNIGKRNGFVKPYTHVRFRYGYTKRTMLFELDKITIGKGNVKWGAPKDKEVFILKLGKRIE